MMLREVLVDLVLIAVLTAVASLGLIALIS